MKQTFDYLPKDYGPRPVTMTSSGIKLEGQPFGELYKTEQEAWKNYNKHLNKYIKGAKEILWRQIPYMRDMRETPDEVIEGSFTVHSRVAIK